MSRDPAAISGALRAHAESVRRREVARAVDELGGEDALSADQRRAIEALADAVVEGILDAPERALEDAVNERTVAAAARVLPGLEAEVERPGVPADSY